VHGAADRLAQIVKNLLSNAVKFTPEGGEIIVALGADEKELRLRVQDNGCGLDPASMQRVFQPFEQLNRKPSNAHGGLGLGLTIAKTLAEAHGGSLSADSAGAGQGATFTLALPLAEETEQAEDASPVDEALLAETAPPAGEAPAPAPKRNVLLVDDHEDTLRTIALLLRRAGYEVETARGVKEAEPLLARAELLISDIGLPDGDGWELMMRFKARGGEAGIAISGFGQEEDIKRSQRAGFARHLVKPINIEVLRAEMRALSGVA
jgi:CheY-like chemotaxis protein